MKKNYIQKCFLVFSLLLSSISYAQVQQAWVARANGVENKNETAGIIAVDASGFVYVAGGRYGTADDNNSGFLTIKYNPVNGHVIWAHINDGEGGGNAGPSAMVVDAAGNVYVTGSSGATSNGDKYFTIKYNTNGDLQWEHSYSNSSAGEQANAIAVDAQGNVFVTGFTFSNGFRCMGTIKYDASGNQKWTRLYHGDEAPGDGTGYAIAVDAAGNVYVAGVGSYNGTFGDIIIVKYNTDGDELSSNRYDGPGDDKPFDMVLDASANIYITGYSTVLNHEHDCITLKYNSNCNIIWERLFNGTASKTDGGFKVAVDASGNVFVGGVTISNHSGSSDDDYLLIKYDADGNQLWNVAYNGAQDVDDLGKSITLDGSGDVYITGYSGNGVSNTSPVDYVTIKYNTDGVQQWLQTYDGPDGYYDDASDIVADANGNIYVTGTSFSDATKNDIATIKYSQCNIICPANITVNNDAGTCGAVVNFPDVTTTGDCGGTISYSQASGSTFPIGTTTVTVTSDETGASCSFTVTVNDNELPVISCPANQTVNTDAGVCYAVLNVGTATATDNCSATVVGVRSDGLALTDNYPGGVTTITWTATDPSNNTATCRQTITVVDNQPPVISGESVSSAVLSPPNHAMQPIIVNYTVTDNCSVTSVISVTSNESVNGTGDGDTDPDWIVIDNHHVQLRAERSANGDGRIYTITITATDGSGNTAVKTVEVRVPHDIKNPHSGQAFKLGSTVALEGEFWDVPGNKHTAKWLIDDNTTAKAAVTEPSGNKNGKITGSYKFTTAGIYKLQMNITDQKGVTTYTNTSGDLEAIVVIYDPNGGNTYGGGYYNSPAGALKSNPSATGKASYGFAMDYFKNSTNPKGETQFEFKVGDFEFNALNFEYLVISNSMAQFKGTGKIIGSQSGVGFIMTVVDGQLDGSGIDKIRIKIYNKNTGEVYYDNQPGASDAALPTQGVGPNSIIVVQRNNINALSTTTSRQIANESQSIDELDVRVHPNPASTYFNVTIKSNNTKEKIALQVFDVYGRSIEVRSHIPNGSTIRVGDLYRPGAYYIRVLQGMQHKEIKLIKVSD